MKTGKTRYIPCWRMLAIAPVWASLLFLPITARAGVRISQIDPSTLLPNQRVKAYISVTDRKGKPIQNLSKENFQVFESANGKDFQQVPEIIDFKGLVNYESGILFLLMVDNSGSMYRGMRSEKGLYTTRIGNALTAIRMFLKNVTNPNDRIGLASYNSYYTLHSDITDDKRRIYDLLSDIRRPIGDEGFTEIYASLYTAVEELRSIKGRKVIIILSDGENRPFYQNTRKKHRDFGTKTFQYTEPLDYCQKEGISVFAINYGTSLNRRDRRLQDIAIATGGAVFDARNAKELSRVYSAIVYQILHEYLITYRATMVPANKRYVKVEYSNKYKKMDTTRFYFASTVFGLPLEDLTPLILLPLLLAFLLAWLLSKIKFEKGPHRPSLEVLDTGPAQSVTRVLNLNDGMTVIGGSENADMTILGGLTRVKERHATVLYDNRIKKYTLVSQGEVKVNNKSAKTRVLESGDVINVGGTTIVFDDGTVD